MGGCVNTGCITRWALCLLGYLLSMTVEAGVGEGGKCSFVDVRGWEYAEVAEKLQAGSWVDQEGASS